MGRFLAGVASAALLLGAGLFWWQSSAAEEPRIPDAPVMRSASVPLLGGPLPDAPRASAGTREERRFSRYDKNRDGSVGIEEYFASRRKAFAKLDGDHDGRLSFDEWATKTREKFAKADADRSSRLSRAEFATTAPVRKAKSKPDCPPTRQPTVDEDEG